MAKSNRYSDSRFRLARFDMRRQTIQMDKDFKKFLLDTFGVPAAKWLAEKGRKKIKAHKTKSEAEELLKAFLLDIGAEHRIEHYMAELAAMDPGPMVRKVREMIGKTRTKKKVAKKRVSKKTKLKKKPSPKKSKKTKKRMR